MKWVQWNEYNEMSTMPTMSWYIKLIVVIVEWATMCVPSGKSWAHSQNEWMFFNSQLVNHPTHQPERPQARGWELLRKADGREEGGGGDGSGWRLAVSSNAPDPDAAGVDV